MPIKAPFSALLKRNLQRLDLTDHALLGEAMFNLSQETLKDLVSDDGFGRVFSGFNVTGTAGSGSYSFSVPAGVAVNGDGELLVHEGSGTANVSTIANNMVYGVYAQIVDTDAPSEEYEQRRIWVPGTGEDTVQVPVKKYKRVTLGIAQDPISPQFTVDSLFGTATNIVPLAAVTIGSTGTASSVIDCRRMWAVNGNVNNTIGLPSELPHNFTPTDFKTQGTTGVRTAFRALASVVSKLIGNDVEGNEWFNGPVIGINQFRDEYVGLLGASGTGVKRVRTVANTTALTAITGAVDKDVAYSQAQNSLYAYSSSSTATVEGIRVVSGNGGVGRWVIHNRGATDVAYGFPGLGADAKLSAQVVRSESIDPYAVVDSKLNFDMFYEVTANYLDGLGSLYGFISTREWVLYEAGHKGGVLYSPGSSIVCDVYKNASVIGTLTFKADGTMDSSFGAASRFYVGDVLKVVNTGGVTLQGGFFSLSGRTRYYGSPTGVLPSP